jgi:hypothetical protein
MWQASNQLHILYRIMGDTLDAVFTERFHAWVEEETTKKSSQVDTQGEEEGGEFLVKWKVRCFAYHLCVCVCVCVDGWNLLLVDFARFVFAAAGLILPLFCCKGLSYTECTWEKEADIDDDVSIAQFYRHQRPTNQAKSSKLNSRKDEKPPIYLKSPGFKSGRELHPYQLEGLNWLLFSWV